MSRYTVTDNIRKGLEHEPAIDACHDAYWAEDMSSRIDAYRKVPHGLLIHLHLHWIEGKESSQYGATAVVLRERGYDPADLDDLRARIDGLPF